jgi:hypothetical protein
MKLKKAGIVFFIMTAFVWLWPGSLNGNKEVPEIYGEIEGTYEMKSPGKLNSVFYIKYYVEDGKLISQQLGDKEIVGLVPKGKDPLTYTCFDGKKVHTHRFFLNDEGKVHKLLLTNRDLKLEGIRLKNITKIKTGNRFTAESLLADFNQMIRIIKYLHPSLYDYTPESEFENTINEVRERITRPMELCEFVRLASPVMAKIGCAHSHLSPPRQQGEKNKGTYLPIRIHFHNNRTTILNSQYSHLTGRDIVSINGIPIHEIVQNILNGLPSDWKNIQFKEYLLNEYFYRFYSSFYGNSPAYELETIDPKNQKKLSMKIEAMSGDDIIQALTEKTRHPVYPQKPYSLTLLNNGDTALLRIKHFSYYQKDQEKAFFEFIDESFEKLKNRKTKKLLIDIRGNMGGSPFASQYLLSNLINRPFQYFSIIHTESYKKLFDPMTPGKNVFTGKIMTLIDGGCLSTSGHFTALLKYHGVGKFAGEKTGSTFSCTDGSTTIRLLNTGLRLRIARERFSAAVKGLKRDEGIDPDYPIERTLEDRLNERDLQLEKAIKLFEKM